MDREIKKLSWWQRTKLCCWLDNHKVQYDAYKDTQDMLYNQKLILNRVQGKRGGVGRGGIGQQPAYIPYDKWHTSQVDWPAIERSLYGSVIAPEDAEEDDDAQDTACDPSDSE